MQHEVSRGRLGTARLMYWSRHYWLDEPAVVAIDTGCGREGFLTAVELPSMKVYESR